MHIPKTDLSEPVFGHGPGGMPRDGAPGQQGVRARRPHRAAQGRRRPAAAAAAGQRLRRRRGRLRLPPDARKSSCRSSSRTWRCRDLVRTQLAETPEWKSQPRRLQQRRHAEQPARGALDARRHRPAHRHRRRRRAPELRALEEQLDALLARPDGRRRAGARSRRSRPRSRRCAARIARIPYLDPIDLRYRNRVRVPVPTSKAVMFCLMDVSGSMDEARKDLTKRFFILLYLFLTRHYEKIDLVFIRHHTQAPGGERGELLPRHARPAARWCPARWC